jgi:hypothetical protein
LEVSEWGGYNPSLESKHHPQNIRISRNRRGVTGVAGCLAAVLLVFCWQHVVVADGCVARMLLLVGSLLEGVMAEGCYWLLCVGCPVGEEALPNTTLFLT